MANWQAALGAGLSSAGDAVFDFYNMKRQKELQDKDEAFRQEQLALQRSLGEAEMQRGMEDLSLRQQGQRLAEKTAADEASFNRNRLGLEEMGLNREALESDRDFTESQKQFGISEGRLGRVADATANYYEDLVGARREADRLRAIQTQLDTTSAAIDKRRESALESVRNTLGGKIAMDPTSLLKAADDYLMQNDPLFKQQLEMRNQLMQQLYGSTGMTPEQIALMQSLMDQSAVNIPAPVAPPVVPGGGGLLRR